MFNSDLLRELSIKEVSGVDISANGGISQLGPERHYEDESGEYSILVSLRGRNPLTIRQIRE